MRVGKGRACAVPTRDSFPASWTRMSLRSCGLREAGAFPEHVRRHSRVARMSAATSGTCFQHPGPACRCAHADYGKLGHFLNT